MMLRLSRFAGAFTLGSVLAACQSPAATSAAPAAHMAVNRQEAAVPMCHAESAQHLIGQKATNEHISQALKDSGATISRVLAPDTPATLDFSPSRLNIITDVQGVIESLHCG